MYKIIDGIYISNKYDAKNINLLKDNKIKTVINLTDDDNYEIYINNSMIYFQFEIKNNYIYRYDLLDIANNIYKIINGSGENILIYCDTCTSLSATIMIYYLIKQYNYTYEDAFDYIKNIIPDINVYYAFHLELKNI